MVDSRDAGQERGLGPESGEGESICFSMGDTELLEFLGVRKEGSALLLCVLREGTEKGRGGRRKVGKGSPACGKRLWRAAPLGRLWAPSRSPHPQPLLHSSGSAPAFWGALPPHCWAYRAHSGAELSSRPFLVWLPLVCSALCSVPAQGAVSPPLVTLLCLLFYVFVHLPCLPPTMRAPEGPG